MRRIHPFREGNGRTQLTYLTLIAARAGHPLALDRMKPDAMLAAMVASFKGGETPLAALVEDLVEPGSGFNPQSPHGEGAIEVGLAQLRLLECSCRASPT